VIQCSCGYDRIAVALTNLGHEVSDQTVGNVLHRHDVPLARKRTATWAEFSRTYGFHAEKWTSRSNLSQRVPFHGLMCPASSAQPDLLIGAAPISASI
jgi:hypothetical protein